MFADSRLTQLDVTHLAPVWDACSTGRTINGNSVDVAIRAEDFGHGGFSRLLRLSCTDILYRSFFFNFFETPLVYELATQYTFVPQSDYILFLAFIEAVFNPEIFSSFKCDITFKIGSKSLIGLYFKFWAY